MSKIRVTAIQRGCVYDGPGVRTTIFLKGCSLHCPWCCNPESISFAPEWFIDDSRCLRNRGMDSILCGSCIRNGGYNGIAECPVGVARPSYEDIDDITLFDRIYKDKDLYGNDGGVTFSGGEPLSHTQDIIPVLRLCVDHHINIAFETTLYVSPHNVNEVIPYTKLMIVDLKLQPEMSSVRDYVERMKENIYLLKNSSVQVLYRMVFVNSMYEERAKIFEILRSLEVKKIELLKCHNLGALKYKKLKKLNCDYTADDGKMDSFVSFLNNKNISVSLLKT